MAYNHAFRISFRTLNMDVNRLMLPTEKVIGETK